MFSPSLIRAAIIPRSTLWIFLDTIWKYESFMADITQKRVLSGIRATGKLHLGNYFGAVKGMLELQNNPQFQTFYMVADAHTLTTPYDVEALRNDRRSVYLDYLSVGLDPEKSVIFQQSEVPYHFELAFYFSSVTTIARMQHLPTFKDKIKQHPNHSTMALLNYPVLMAADILLYKADLVPVGIDQEPHLEVSREIARKMNQTYGTKLPEPVRFATSGEYIPGLVGEGKMSKSVAGSAIDLNDSLEAIQSKVAKIATDGGKGMVTSVTAGGSVSRQEKKYLSQGITEGEGAESFGVKTLFTLVELFEGQAKRSELEALYSGAGVRYGDVKKDLSQAIFTELAPIQEKRRELEAQPKMVDEIIASGNEKARQEAQKNLTEIKTSLGL